MGGLGLLSVLKSIWRDSPERFSSAIAGVKLGDRILFSGAGDISLVTEMASGAGLSGRVVSLAPTADLARERAARIEAAGALVEAEHAPLNMLPFDAASFDLAVAEETLSAMPERDRRSALAEMLRVLRPGGRLLWIERARRGGVFGAAPGAPTADAASFEAMMRDAGFRGVRVLATARGHVYLEGIKAATS